MARFTVDTHLFRELGALLVGRDSTALIELVKNAYDADATRVIVTGEGIRDHGRGMIVVQDDGHGMAADDFESGFLRVASRSKELGERRSPGFHRRYTGAKGIGRLAAHKLARQIEIASVASPRPTRREHQQLTATIDWDRIEQFETLDEVEGTDAIQVSSQRWRNRQTGTVITLRRLRRRWTATEHGRFLEEVQTFQPPSFLTDRLPKTVLPKTLLFSEPPVRDSAKQDPGFTVELAGDLAPPDAYWQAAINAADWIIEIEAASDGIRYGIAPTEKVRHELPDATSRVYQLPHPSPQEGPFFTARILMRTGVMQGPKNQSAWLGRISGVRVYMEGFRVLPYGDGRSDWLSLNRDVVDRSRSVLDRSPIIASLEREIVDANVGLHHLPEKHYFGAVFLRTEEARCLDMLINREGFLPNESFEILVNIVRGGIDLATRVRASVTAPRREERRQSRVDGAREVSDTYPVAGISEIITEAQELVSSARALADGGRFMEAGPQISAAAVKLNELATQTKSISEEAAMLRVLASLGGQLASFVHELNAVLTMTEAIELAVSNLRSAESDPAKRGKLAEIARSIGDLRRQVEKQASFLVDVVTPDARRRRRRIPLAQAFDSAARLVSEQAARQNIDIRNEIPSDLRTPLMFPAEITMVFSNLLTNAVKAARTDGLIRATGRTVGNSSLVIRIENTGVDVDPSGGERWFRPFESSSAVSSPKLGYGMGLGLPITRSMLEEYGAEIKFVKPHARFATALEISFPLA